MKKHITFFLTAIIFMVVSLLTTANATVRTFQFTGVITSGTGTSFVATLSYDDSQLPIATYTYRSQYLAYSFVIVVDGSNTYTQTPGSVLNVWNDHPSLYDNFSNGGVGLGGPQFYLIDNTQTAFNSQSLPSTLSIGSFSSATVSVVGTPISGIITSITDISQSTIIIKKETDPSSSGTEFFFSSPHILTVNSPGSIVGDYTAGYAYFGPSLDITGITGDLQLADPILGSPYPLADLTGKIAVIDRGQVTFVTKVINAQDAGAIAVIIINSLPGGGILNMGGADVGITIPSIFISYEDGQDIKTALSSGTVNATLHSDFGRFTLQDGDMKTFDNIPAGSYTLTEDDQLFQGVVLSDIGIVDPSGGSSKDVSNRTVTISLAAGETVECTFYNTLVFEKLIANVEDLKSSGVLNNGQANALIVKLNGAKNKLLQGKTNTAINKLNAFINQVEDFISDGVLTSAQGQPMIDEVNNFIDLLNNSLAKSSDTEEGTELNSEIPEDYNLSQNYPNPFNPSTVIRYSLPEDAKVSIVVYDILGEQVAELVNGNVASGSHQVTFDGGSLASGIYFYRLTAGSFTQINKMILMK